ncbi:alpha/beta hydrolase [Mangrovibacterium diazotrophicum]|uniref:S-formylglutathione hydrolase FrmB n=1 Tax=Mangrovibacterium diazotrophicum TaxID=1261403 RepID=A0A419VY76_9BACT|nr:alpha/beta hydrolase-fold protein [Mangrovibacterium diazotrophicum]RKD88185.1 S-formylglutathione hydrolase FrmB [Mangrovibacterium diazotrophicum]
MKKISTLILFVLMGLGAFAQFPQLPHGQVSIDSLKSEVLGVNRQYSVYLPKSYETSPNRKYPILYLLHGVFDNNNGWVMRGHLQDVSNKLIDAGEAHEMIIIVPDAGRDWNGYFDMDGWSYETFFFTEFMPYIENKYRVIGDKKNRAIAGLSMGGGGTTVYAQKHPDLFSSAYAMSALMGLPEGGGIPAQDKKMAELNRTVIENHCVKFVENADEATKETLRAVRWFVDCGDDDFLFDVNTDFYKAMRNAHIPCQLRVRDGGHDWEYWHSALYKALAFVSDGFDN